MIYEELTRWDFVKGFDEYGRGNNFSVAAREWLYDYLDGFSQDTGDDIKFDPVAICCDWTEYEKFSDLVYDYGYMVDLPNDAPENEMTVAKIEQMLGENTNWVKLDNGAWLVESF